jgi:tRNA threonylcarbamoyladenosine biosynthesis protein TsaE
MGERVEDAVVTASAAETEAAGAALAADLARGDVVLVRGDLGAGKTTLVRGACRALGVTEPVTSPTFTIGQVYEGSSGDGEQVLVSHLDLYRLAGLEAEDPSLIEDYFGPDRIVFLEWPEIAAAPLAGRATREVDIDLLDGDRRRLTVS